MNYQQKMTIERWKRKPFVMYGFLAAQTIVFILMTVVPSLDIEYAGGMAGIMIVYKHEFWRFFTPIVIHFGLAHYAMNSVTLYFMGEQIESLYGHWRFFVIYLFSGVMGNLASFAFNDPRVLSAGASTSLFGMFGAFLILGRHFPNNYAIKGMVQRFTLFIGLNLAMNLLDSSIDIWGHVGGLVGGLLLGTVVALPKAKDNYSIHERIICGMIFAFLAGICLVLGFKKYGLLV